MTRRSASTPRGALLLEVLVAIAVFVVAASITLAMVRDGLGAMDRAERRAMAVDLARTGMAGLEAGLINLADLRAGTVTAEGEPPATFDDRFVVEVRTRRTAYRGLTLVELRVRDADAAGDAPPLCTLRQFVRLRGPDEGEEAPVDELSSGLGEEIDAPPEHLGDAP